MNSVYELRSEAIKRCARYWKNLQKNLNKNSVVDFAWIEEAGQWRIGTRKGNMYLSPQDHCIIGSIGSLQSLFNIHPEKIKGEKK